MIPAPSPRRASVVTHFWWSTLVILGMTGSFPANVRGAEPEQRAIAFLAREVPAWSAEHRCFSCHNNGDGARALFDARLRGWKVADGALTATSAWLANPAGWRENGGDGPFSDRRLARLQFSLALAASVASGNSQSRPALIVAAKELAADQLEDGRWTIDGPEALGSPATYGTPLATWFAMDVLRQADETHFRTTIEKARSWLARLKPVTLLDGAAILFAGVGDRDAALSLIQTGQSDDGGWGPYSNSPPEPFDTAVVLISLTRIHGPTPEIASRLRRGRAYLVATQGEDGAWTETTRPAGGESYAQRLSTTGWATLALLATSPKPPR
ncbi:hypothetical protein EP7_003581 [Isosphaeraceae bacterium EP7]